MDQHGVTATRYKNARKLMEQHGGVLKLGEQLGMAKAQASHLFGRNPYKGIGHQIARHIEATFRLPEGWLDIDHDMLAEAAASARIRRSVDTVEVPVLAGNDPSYPIHSVVFSGAWIRRALPNASHAHLALTTNNGDAMAPTIADRATVIVDRSRQSIRGDGVYAMTGHETTLLRRVSQELDGSLTISSDNPIYERTRVGAMEAAGIKVAGKVVAALDVRLI